MCASRCKRDHRFQRRLRRKFVEVKNVGATPLDQSAGEWIMCRIRFRKGAGPQQCTQQVKIVKMDAQCHRYGVWILPRDS